MGSAGSRNPQAAGMASGIEIAHGRSWVALAAWPFLAIGRGRPAALRHAMNRWMVAPSVAGSPRCSMIATRVGDTSRIVTSAGLKVFCMSLLLALSKGPKAASHGSQSGDVRNDDGDCPNRCRKARGEGIRCIVTGIHRDVRDAVGIRVSQPV